MLLEMPDGQIPLGADRFVRHLMRAGIRPVIVHPERNRAVMERVDRLEPLVDEGCYVQVTAGSLVGSFGAAAQAASQVLLDRGWVQAVASDAHNLTGRRPRMREAADWLRQHYGAETARKLTVTGPASLAQHNAQVNQVPATVAASAAAARG
jgi:protein-tyrosine phosphatase